MRRAILLTLSLIVVFSMAGKAQAFVSKSPKSVIAASASGISDSTSLSTSVVQQLTGNPATLGFEGTANDFRNSGEAIKVNISSNIAGNRLIMYTANFATDASPKACFDTGNNNPNLGPIGDGGGLVGDPAGGDPNACKNTVPVVWAVGVINVTPTSNPKVFDGDSTNVAYTFNPVTAPGVGASNAVFITDRAHVLTFTTDSALDNLDLVYCSDGSALADARARADGDGLYPQFFGEEGKNSDLCRATDLTTVVSQELSKNIAVVGFGFSGAVGFVPRLDTSANDDVIKVSSPLYLPIGADFRYAPPGNYATNKLTLEIVTQ